MSVRPRAPSLQVEWFLGSPSFFEAFGSSPYIHLVHILAFEDLLALRQSVVDLSVVAEQTFTCVALHLQKEEVLSCLMQPWEWICMSFHAHLDRLQFLRPSTPSLLQAVPNGSLGLHLSLRPLAALPISTWSTFWPLKTFWHYGRALWTFQWWPSRPLLVWRCTCKKRKC